MCNFYYLGEGDSMIMRPQYITEFRMAYLFPLYYLMVLIGFLTLRKGFLITINILVIILSILTLFIIQLGFAWWGVSPFHPDLSFGYWLSHLILLIVVIRTFTLTSKLKEIELNKKITLLFSYLTIIIPLGFIITVITFINHENNRPIKRSEWEHQEGNRFVKNESWDYTESYDAFVTKYFSKDTLNKEKYQLDSVEFMFFDDKLKVKKEFTKVVSSGSINIEEILESND